MEFNQDSSLNDAIEFLENEKNKLEQRLYAQKKLDEIIPINLENNLETFRKFFPNIYAKFKDYKLKSNYRLTCSENGEANILLPEGTLFYGDSPFHDCEKQVEIFLENQKEHLISNFNCAFEKNTYNQLHYYFKNRIYGKATEIVEKNKNISESNETLESIPLMIMYGLGLGYHLSYLYEKFTPINMYIIEPNEDFFYLSLCVFDYSTLINYINERKLGLKFIFSDDPTTILNDINKYSSRYGMNLAVKSFFTHYSSNHLNKIKELIFSELSSISIKSGFFDDALTGMCQSCTNILNGTKLLTNGQLPDNFGSIPAIVVGNGPSLDTELEQLKNISNRICIIACGTALTALSKYGIKADIYVAVERAEEVYESLLVIKDPEVFENVLCIAPDIVHPKTLNMFKHKIIAFKLNETMPIALAQLSHLNGNIKKCAGLNWINPLVSNMGVSVATILGFKKIYMLGIDNGSAYKEIHSIHSCYFDENQQLVPKWIDDSLDALPLTHQGNFRPLIKTNTLYKISIHVFEELISKNKDKYYFNASDGAKIEGAEPKRLSDINWNDFSNFDHEELRNYIINSMSEKLNITKNDFLNILKLERYDEVANILIDDLQKLPVTREEIVLRLELHFDFLQNLIKEGSIACRNVLFGSLQLMYAGYLVALYSNTDQNKAIDECRPLLDLIIQFIQKTQKYYPRTYEYDYNFVNEHVKKEEEQYSPNELQ